MPVAYAMGLCFLLQHNTHYVAVRISLKKFRPKGTVKHMEEYKLEKMNRKELLELLLQQVSENEAMKEQLKALKTEMTAVQQDCEKRLADRRIELSRAGTMAEAALRLNRVFADADLAVRQYHENIKKYSENAEALANSIKEEADRKADEILAAAEKTRTSAEASAQSILEKARQDAEKILNDAGKQASDIRLEADEYQKEVKGKMKDLYSTYESLQSILGNK